MRYKTKQGELLKKLIIDYKHKRIRYLDIKLRYNNEFLTLLKHENNLYKQLKEVLPQEYSSLLLHYNDAVTEIEVFKQKFYYYSGYNDAEFIYSSLK